MRVVVVLALMLPGAALALQCIHPQLNSRDYARSLFVRVDAVFVGTLKEVRSATAPLRPEAGWIRQSSRGLFTIERAFKGALPEELEVHVRTLDVKPGKRYLVYAWRFEDALTTEAGCGPRPFDLSDPKAAAHFEMLESLDTLPPPGSGGDVIATIVAYGDPRRSDEIVLQGESQAFKQRSRSKDGRYPQVRFTGVPAGRYRIVAPTPPGSTLQCGPPYPSCEIEVIDREVRHYNVDPRPGS